MDSKSLKTWQARKVHQSLRPSLQYLNRLQARMQKVGFPPDDVLLKLTTKARDAMHELFIAMHYASCASGVGKSRS